MRNLRACISALSIVVVAALSAAAAEPGQGDRPNVLFVAIDDLNDWVGCMGGHPQAKTPHIDRLAAQGALFLNAHCSAPLCNPSRASVMTGLLPSTSGVHGNQQDWRQSPFVQGKPTLAEYFRQHGYWTGACGKIFHANHGGECAALNGGHGGLQGFDHPASWMERFPSHDRQLAKPAVLPGQNMNGLDIWHWDWGPIDAPIEQTTDGQSVAWAEQQLAKQHERPFFLAVGIYKPHGPWYAPREFFDQHPLDKIMLPALKDDDLDDVPAIAKRYLNNYGSNLHQQVLDHGLYPNAVQAYLANITFADAMLGRVLDALQRSPYADNTIVCLWSDHGWHLGEKKRWHKSTLWEEATRVPLIIKAPNIGQPGSRTLRPASLVDLYPTLVELCGLPPREDLDGQSLAPQLADPLAERVRPAITTRGGRDHSVRGERWRYIRYSDGAEELYDHASDPDEYVNLAGDPRFAEQKKELAAWIPEQANVVNDPSETTGESGFRPIFNGYDLTSWDGDPALWSVEDGKIVGRTAADAPLAQNTFLIWRGAVVGDFELRLSFKVSGEAGFANSGVQYRSRELPDEGKWVLAGYQADIDLDNQYAGILYEERGRGILAQRGEKVLIKPAKEETGDEKRSGQAKPQRTIIGSRGDVGEIAASIRPGEWNDYAILVRGNRLIHRINDTITVDVIDDDPLAASSGLIGLQLHRGEPMTVEFKNLRINTFFRRKNGEADKP